MATHLQKYKTIIKALVALCVLSSLAGCEKPPAPVKGFVLPKGDIEMGQKVFAETGCLTCHSIAKLTLPDPAVPRVLDIPLGGKFYRVKSYGELLTSIVNPDHAVLPKHLVGLPEDAKKLENSPMPDFNDGMTVTQLIDLVEFLHSRYEELGPGYRGYYYVP